VSDQLRPAGLHAHVKQLLLEGESVASFEEHVVSCLECSSTAARLAAIDRLLLQAPYPRVGLLREVLERTTAGRRAEPSNRGTKRVQPTGGGSAVTAGVHVLLVEHDPTVSDMYRVRLEMDGYRVLAVRDGRTAVRLIREVRPTLVLLDYELPRLDGPWMLRALRDDERTRSQAVAVLADYDEPRWTTERYGLGVLAWLVKSHITPGELSAVVRRLIDQSVVGEDVEREDLGSVER